jgi:diadenosine tetraphosphate (Ap4A) HIT family hydrolase
VLVAETEATVAFLDRRPIFPGHTLVVPRRHVETLRDLPDGLRGFFWPRTTYADEDAAFDAAGRIREALPLA